MASLQQKSDTWHCQFVCHGKRHTFTVGKVPADEDEANQVDYLLMRLKQGFIKLPVSMDIVTFLEFDGNPPAAVDSREPLTLGGLRDRYFATHGNGSLEQSTIDGMKVHFRQLVQTLGEKYPIEDLALVDLQSRTDRRAKMNGQKGRLSPATIRKEIVTRRTSWNWAAHMGLLKSSFTSKGLSYPKFEERPPFQTWGKIERQIALGRRTKKQQRELWDSLYLTFPDNHLARSTHVERGGFRAYTTTKPE